MNVEKIQKLDERVFEVSKKIRLLKSLSWPCDEENKFLNSWRANNPKLPDFKLEAPDLIGEVIELEKMAHQCDENEPVEKYLYETAMSYATSAKLLMSVGTPQFTRESIIIYGRPDDRYKTQDLTVIDSAKFFLKVTKNLLGNFLVPTPDYNISAKKFAASLKEKIDGFFEHDQVKVVLDNKISARALAGSRKIRISETEMFSQLDKNQLLNHEAFIHAATMLNGRKQTHLKCLGLGAPRTTKTQEGLAVASEVLTHSIDIARLRRIALRVLGVQKALEGADFIEVFKFFLDEGQSELDAVRSTERIFRGGHFKGGVVFTKDSVYLQGLLEIHTFMKLAIWHNKPEYILGLFAGRLTMGDVIRMRPLFESGWLVAPVYVPRWASDFRKLAAQMAYSAFISNINLDGIKFEHFIDLEERRSGTAMKREVNEPKDSLNLSSSLN